MKLAILLAIAIGGSALLAAGCSDNKSPRARAVSTDEQAYVKLLKSDSDKERADAATKLGDLRAESREAIDGLGKALLDTQEKVAKAAAKALGKIGTEDSLKTLRSGITDMEKVNSKALDDARDAYKDAVHDLQKEAQKGNDSARKTLESLKEPTESSGTTIDVGKTVHIHT